MTRKPATDASEGHAAVITPMPVSEQKVSPSSKSVWKGLLWCEWFSQSKLLLGFFASWLAIVWMLPLYANPGWILFFGVIYACVAGPAYGGGDTIEGSEEFSFSLPATRSETYLARLIVGGGSVLMFALFDLLVLGLDLPQMLAKIYVDTGLLAAQTQIEFGLLGGLIVFLPFATFSFSFAIAANAHSRAFTLSSGFWGLLLALLALRLGLFYESFRWDNWNGYVSQPFLLIVSIGSLILGYRKYKTKEIGKNFNRFVIPSHWWIWIITFMVAAAAAIFLITSLVSEFQNFRTNP